MEQIGLRNPYDLPFKSYSLFCSDMQNEVKWLLTQQYTAIQIAI